MVFKYGYVTLLFSACDSFGVLRRTGTADFYTCVSDAPQCKDLGLSQTLECYSTLNVNDVSPSCEAVLRNLSEQGLVSLIEPEQSNGSGAAVSEGAPADNLKADDFDDWFDACLATGNIPELCPDMDRGTTFNCLGKKYSDDSESIHPVCNEKLRERAKRGTSSKKLKLYSDALKKLIEACPSVTCPEPDFESISSILDTMNCLAAADLETVSDTCKTVVTPMLKIMELQEANDELTEDQENFDVDAALDLIENFSYVKVFCPEITCDVNPPTLEDIKGSVKCLNSINLAQVSNQCKDAVVKMSRGELEKNEDTKNASQVTQEFDSIPSLRRPGQV